MRFSVNEFWVLVSVLGVALPLSGERAKAAVITQWTFSSSTGTSASNTNTPAPTTGSGYANTVGNDESL